MTASDGMPGEEEMGTMTSGARDAMATGDQRAEVAAPKQSPADLLVLNGPWEAHRQPDGDWEVRAFINEQRHYVLLAFDLNEPVARRIAATQAMLAALRALVAIADADDGQDLWTDEYRAAVEDGTDAIAGATGAVNTTLGSPVVTAPSNEEAVVTNPSSLAVPSEEEIARLRELLAAYPEPWEIVKEPHDYKDGTTHFTHVQYRAKPAFAKGEEITVEIGSHVTPDLAELLILLRKCALALPQPAGRDEGLEEEIAALCNFLEIALDEHDDHFGVTDETKRPKNWDVQARKRLTQARLRINGE